MDIKAWLEENGMGEHWEKFESNKIDEDTLKSMTENDLKDIGIDALGDRKTLIAGISKLRGGSSSGDGGGTGKGALISGVVGFLIGYVGCATIGGGGFSQNQDNPISFLGGVFSGALFAILGTLLTKK